MLKILAVDDQPLNLDILREMLDAYSVRTARDGSEAIEVAKKFLPDVILLDVMMPILGGLDICRQLREIAELKGTRIILVSAKAMAHERELGLNAGADAYLTKPFDECELYEVMQPPSPKVELNKLGVI